MDQSGVDKGPRRDDEMKKEAEDLERSGKDSHVKESREQQGSEDQSLVSGHRISGTGSSADTYPYQDRGEEGGASHPGPREGE